MKTSENAEEAPDDTEPADRNIQMEDFSVELYSPSIGAVTKNYLWELRSGISNNSARIHSCAILDEWNFALHLKKTFLRLCSGE